MLIFTIFHRTFRTIHTCIGIVNLIIYQNSASLYCEFRAYYGLQIISIPTDTLGLADGYRVDKDIGHPIGIVLNQIARLRSIDHIVSTSVNSGLCIIEPVAGLAVKLDTGPTAA